ncbi:MAG: polysaccharide deacetylase family protein [Nocardioides sp.]
MVTLLLAPTAWFPPLGADTLGAAAATNERVGGCSSGYVSLTFDDGPSAQVTPDLVRILRRAQVPATFFMVGQRVAANPRTARMVARSGFLIANHSYAHADMTTQSPDQVVETLRATDSALRRAGTRPTRLMRPPYGAIDDGVRQAVRRAGLLPVLWDIDPRDYAGGSSADIAASILAQLRPGRSNVVLQHDGVRNSPASVAAVPVVVREARRRGYCFTALDERGRPGFPTPTVALDVDRARVPEGGRVRWRLTLDKPTARSTAVDVQLRSPATGRILATVPATFKAGRLTTSGSLKVPRDGRDQTSERWDLDLVNPVGLRVPAGTSSSTVVILDRDPAPTVSGTDRMVDEPAEEPRTITVRFRLDQVSGRTIRAVVHHSYGTADKDDVVPVRTPVTFPPGTRSVAVQVTLRPDSEDPVAADQDGNPAEEGEESFTLVIGSHRHVRPGRPVTITIRPFEAAPTDPQTPPGPAAQPASPRGSVPQDG